MRRAPRMVVVPEAVKYETEVPFVEDIPRREASGASGKEGGAQPLRFRLSCKEGERV